MSDSQLSKKKTLTAASCGTVRGVEAWLAWDRQPSRPFFAAGPRACSRRSFFFWLSINQHLAWLRSLLYHHHCCSIFTTPCLQSSSVAITAFKMPATALSAPVPDAAKDAIISKLRQPPAAGPSSSSEPTATSSSPIAAASPSNVTEPPASASDIETVSLQQHTFQEPRKRIVSPASLHRFEQSSAFAEILAFIRVCNTSVVGKTLTDDIETSPVCHALLSILDEVAALRKSTPPDASIGSSRFGNPAFRTFYAKIRENNDRLHRMIPGLEDDSEASRTARAELAVYLQESWGNEKRIDYGSGMELNMACWL